MENFENQKRKVSTNLLVWIVLINFIIDAIQYILLYIEKSSGNLPSWVGIQILLQVVFTPLAIIALIILLVRLVSKEKVEVYTSSKKLFLWIFFLISLGILIYSLAPGVSNRIETSNYQSQQNSFFKTQNEEADKLYQQLQNNPSQQYIIKDSPGNYQLLIDNGNTVYVLPQGVSEMTDWRPLFQQYVKENLIGKSITLSLPSKNYFEDNYCCKGGDPAGHTQVNQAVDFFSANAYINGVSVFDSFMQWKNTQGK